jgi:glycerol-3-phosphate acyltransferase PlsX
VNGVVIIAHGSSSGLAVRNAIRVAVETVEHKINPRIEEAMAALPEAAVAHLPALEE